MKRIVIIVIAVFVLGVGGWSAFWFANKSEVQEQVILALETLERAGAPNKYDAVEVSGFPFAYKASVTRFVMDNAHSTVTIPSVSAEVALSTGETVTFRMPERFEVLDKASGALFEVVSSGLEASVTPSGEDAYDLALSADALKIASATEGAPGPIEIKTFKASGVMAAQPDQNRARLALAASAAESRQAFAIPDEQGGMIKGTAVANGAQLSVEGSLEALLASFSSDRLLLEFQPGGVVELNAPSYSLSAKPKERFDPAPMAGAKDFQTALLAFSAMAVEGVANGGSFATRFKMDGLKGSGEIGDKPNSADIGPLSLAADFGAERIGLDFHSDKALLDIKLPDGSEIYYSSSDTRSAVQATPADAFDFASLPSAGEALGETLMLAIWDQIQRGGAVEMISNSGPSVSRTLDPTGASGFAKLESRAGPSTFRLAVNPNEAVLALTQDELSYSVSEGLTAAAAVKRVAIDFYSPLKASPAKQLARLRLGVDDVTLDEAGWSMVDPESALKREIKGLRANADASLEIRRDVLSPKADIYNILDPVAIPGRVTFKESYLDLLGLRAEWSGEVALTPLPSGALDVNLIGWRGFFASIQKTPMAQDPQTVSALLIVDDIAANYGEPLDPAAPEADALRFKVEIGGPTGLAINGKPYTGAAPQPNSGG